MADRVKHQVVKFENGRARVYITDDISNIKEDDTTLINPDRSYVMGVSPEFWTIKDGKLWPIEDEKLIAEINASAAALAPSSDLKRIEILQRIEANEDQLKVLSEALKDDMVKLEVDTNEKIHSRFSYLNETDGEIVKLLKVARSEDSSSNKEKFDAISKSIKVHTIIIYSLIAVAMSIAIFL
jgi:hypothetical protein